MRLWSGLWFFFITVNSGAQDFHPDWVRAAQISIQIDELGRQGLDNSAAQAELKTQMQKLQQEKTPLYAAPLSRSELQERIEQSRAEIERLSGDEKRLTPLERESKYERIVELQQNIQADLRSFKTAPRDRVRGLASEPNGENTAAELPPPTGAR